MENKQVVNVPGGKNIEIVIRVFDNPSSAVDDAPDLNEKLKEAEERVKALKFDKTFFADKAQALETENNSLQEKFESVRRLVELHEQYKNLSEHIRADFDGLIFDQSPVTFAMSFASVDCLKRFYRKLENAVANSADEIESQMTFPNHLKILAAVFDFFFNNYINGTSNINCSRQHIAVGSSFDETHCYRVGRRIGKVKEVLIQGFAVEGKTASQSIVLVEDF